MPKCEARITRTYKRAKADSEWPYTIHSAFPDEEKEVVINPRVKDKPICGGELRIYATAYSNGGCSCCGYATVEALIECSKCKNPFHPRLEEVKSLIQHEGNLSGLLEEKTK